MKLTIVRGDITEQRVDAIVVGGGVMGASTAWWLARRGVSTVVLEQFEPEHTRGSSHGGSRIFRLAYPEPFWVGLARAAGLPAPSTGPTPGRPEALQIAAAATSTGWEVPG